MGQRVRTYRVWRPLKAECEQCHQVKAGGRDYAVLVMEGPAGKSWSDMTVSSANVCSEHCADAFGAAFGANKEN